eukprot:TRINITY_DN10952_c0_g1_i2.p1 TRINITY_DN10952_c0_g1~~TRINITY_DN10952_c0_g1_i2.p1  ORF type:complete len:1094 (-),score=205.18 TRINITY_DN10952_c0_g1_i2:108-2945(-)
MALTDRDMACAEYTPAPGPCRSGLPFYRLVANDMSPSLCFRFCLSKGLDLSGTINSTECRCGATRRLSAIWEMSMRPIHLTFDHMLAYQVPDSSADCQMTVYNYTGKLLDGGIPRYLTSTSRADERYVATVVAPRVSVDAAAAKDYVQILAGMAGNSTVAAATAATAAPANQSAGTAAAAGTAAGNTSMIEVGAGRGAPVQPLMALETGERSAGSAQREALDVAAERHRRLQRQSRLQFSSTETVDTAEHWGVSDICVELNADGDCTEVACECHPKETKETLMLADGKECWACAPHCNQGAGGCGQIPCRCDARNFEVAVAWTIGDSGNSCIKCVEGKDEGAVEPWPRPPGGNASNRGVVVPYLLEEVSAEHALGATRASAFLAALTDFQQAVPCIRFRRIPESTKFNDSDYAAGHFIHVLKPPKETPWCMMQNPGNRRRSQGLINPALYDVESLQQMYLRTMSTAAFNGPTLLWMGHCSGSRWIPKIIHELGHILGLRDTVERPDATATWKDPWSVDAIFHSPHITLAKANLVNTSAEIQFKPKIGAYTGSEAQGLLDPFNGYANYDFYSIMHPDVRQSSKEGAPAFRTEPNGMYDEVVGTFKTLSDGDARSIADLYQCNTDLYFMDQGYRQGQSVTSMHYEELSHIVTSDIASTQAWIVTKSEDALSQWIQTRLDENRWQLSSVRYMPKTKAFMTVVDSNRWSRRRAGGKAVQRYYVGKNFEKFRTWMEEGHTNGYLITDMSGDGPFVTSVMTQFPKASQWKQSVFWSSNWTGMMQQVNEHARMFPAYAVTNMMQYSNWQTLGQGCCASPLRSRYTIWQGVSDADACKYKCLEFTNCGYLDINASGTCTIFSTEWVVSMTTHTDISMQIIKLSQNEPETIHFINEAYLNDTQPARISSLVAAHWGGFAMVLSTSAATGPPYWAPPANATQRFAINQPYEGYIR